MNLSLGVNFTNASVILQALRSVMIIKLCKAIVGQHVHDKWSYYYT